MDLMHPNLLKDEQIVAILKERQLNIPKITEIGREELIRLYERFIMPQPCRRARERDSRSANTTSTVGKDRAERANANGELKRKHKEITFTDDDCRAREVHYKVMKMTNSAAESNTRPVAPQRTSESCPQQPQHNPPSKRMKITWP
ncbi:uncharacterized protein LOC132261410 [Phlebotomus argentipes]|uniref:uncharacterized protein LOC132261410 n=1 Tax=Phlebotomus argentipes TaxID=94469 RepID=UPI002893835A|nr:uncharacterized protein LOC132261410 [Phlebotomus argentipes]